MFALLYCSLDVKPGIYYSPSRFACVAAVQYQVAVKWTLLYRRGSVTRNTLSVVSAKALT